MKQDYCLADIATFLDAELRGDAGARITGLNTLQNASKGDLAFLANPKYANQLVDCQAEAVILHPAQADNFSGSCLILDNPYLGYAKITAWFSTEPDTAGQIHPSAIVGDDALLGDDVMLGPNVVIESGAKIGAGSVILANSYVGARSVLGENCHIAANVSIYHDVIMGAGVRVHSGSVIGADGFGFAPDGAGGWHKIHQVGGVSVGDNVEIGACTTVDRGALDNTIIGNGVILDNHVQIAHNCVVGDGTAMASYSGMAGSARVGRNCILGGDACVVGHVTVCDGVTLTARTLVTKNITEPGSYSSGSTPLMSTSEWRRNSARIGQLDGLARRLKKLEKQLEDQQ
jgi:UDP-3-O-[3-hydroxymyristoyl] glucosamine N-acyltransferase